MFLFCIVLTLCMGSSALRAEEIQAGTLRMTWQHNQLTLSMAGADHPFLTGIQIGAISNLIHPNVSVIKNEFWGSGQCLTWEEPSGDRSQIILYERLPFALLRRTLKNSSSELRVVTKDTMLETSVDLGLPAGQLITMSTAGLRPVAGHPGGYSFMALGAPLSRQGIVCGWLTHAKGSGIVFTDANGDTPVLRARIDYGDWRIPAGQSADTETLLIGYFDDIRLGLEQYAQAIAREMVIHLPAKPSVYCTWYHGGASDETKLAANTQFAHDHLASYGMQVIQIDDKWQAGASKNGPNKDFSQIKAGGPYPSGMKPTADNITAQGLTPGIWFMPFAGTWNDPAWSDKMDLFYREGDSQDNYIAQTNGDKRPDFPPGEAPYVARWGGTCLDMTNPKTQDYLRGIVTRIAHDWGYRYFKMDGLWTGTGTRLQYVNSAYKDDDLGQTRRFNPLITPIEAYRKGLEIVRQTAGPDVFLLGCCVPQNMRSFGPAFGKVDAMRVGPDNGANPDGLIRGPQFSTRVWFLNQRVWYNDPDPVYVRPSFPEQMARTSVSWTSLTGSLHSSSYQYADLPPERLDILLRSLPSHTLTTVRPVDYLEADPARIWHLMDDREPVRKDIIGLFNWDVKNSVTVACPLDRIDLPQADRFAGFDFWANQFIPDISGAVKAELPPGGCRIIALRPVTDHPQAISTSRHLTQGVVDLSQENWNPQSKQLSGLSQIVGNDPYEIRIVVPLGANSWKLNQVKLTGAPDETRTTFVQDGPAIRIRINSPANSAIGWQAQFEPAAIKVTVPKAVTNLTATADASQVTLRWDTAEGYGYRIQRDGQTIVTISETTCLDSGLTPGQSCQYTVQTRGWDGQWSQPATLSFTLPKLAELPPTPPLPTIYCDSLKPITATTGWGSLNMNKSCSGGPLTINKTVYQRGIGAHAPSTLVYAIPAGARQFVATVGLDDDIRDDDRASIQFKVIGDVREMGEPPVELASSPILTNGRQRLWHFQIPLDQRLRELRLIVEETPDGKSADHANWVNAGFLTK